MMFPLVCLLLAALVFGLPQTDVPPPFYVPEGFTRRNSSYFMSSTVYPGVYPLTPIGNTYIVGAPLFPATLPSFGVYYSAATDLLCSVESAFPVPPYNSSIPSSFVTVFNMSSGIIVQRVVLTAGRIAGGSYLANDCVIVPGTGTDYDVYVTDTITGQFYRVRSSGIQNRVGPNGVGIPGIDGIDYYYRGSTLYLLLSRSAGANLSSLWTGPAASGIGWSVVPGCNGTMFDGLRFLTPGNTNYAYVAGADNSTGRGLMSVFVTNDDWVTCSLAKSILNDPGITQLTAVTLGLTGNYVAGLSNYGFNITAQATITDFGDLETQNVTTTQQSTTSTSPTTTTIQMTTAAVSQTNSSVTAVFIVLGMVALMLITMFVALGAISLILFGMRE